MSIDVATDLIYFALVVIWVKSYEDLKEFDPTNHFLEEDHGPEENFMVNVLWYIHCSSSTEDAHWCRDSIAWRQDFLLAGIAFVVWFKLFLTMRVSETFGPMYKMIWNML